MAYTELPTVALLGKGGRLGEGIVDKYWLDLTSNMVD